MVYPALLPLMHTPRLLVVDRTDDPVNLNGLVRFAERRNLKRNFKHSLRMCNTDFRYGVMSDAWK